MSAVPLVTLNNGTKCPQIGLGTWMSYPGEVEHAVKTAIDLGYRHFDTAYIYANEKEIGDAIKEKIADGTVKREDLFVTSKLWNTFHEKELVVPYCQKSLENFGLDYIDLFLIHWPVAYTVIGELDFTDPFNVADVLDHDFVDTWRGMEECVRLGLTKSIGVSNFNMEQVERILDNCSIKPAINQVEIQPNLTQKGLIKFCKDRGVQIIAYSPLGSPARPWLQPGDALLEMDNPHLINLSRKHNKSPAQIILRYIVQLGCIPIPKSVHKERLAENINIYDFILDAEDMVIMDSFNIENGRGRAITAKELFDMPNYPFEKILN